MRKRVVVNLRKILIRAQTSIHLCVLRAKNYPGSHLAGVISLNGFNSFIRCLNLSRVWFSGLRILMVVNYNWLYKFVMRTGGEIR